jgi:hypothetical protein
LVQTVHYFIASGQLKSRTACAATEALLMAAAEDRGPLMHVHVRMMMLALHGAKPIREYKLSKEKHWGRRKLKREE